MQAPVQHWFDTPGVVPAGQFGGSARQVTMSWQRPGEVPSRTQSWNGRGHSASVGHGSVECSALHPLLREQFQASAMKQSMLVSTD